MPLFFLKNAWGASYKHIHIFFCTTPSGAFPTHFPCSDFDFNFFVCSPKPNRTRIRVTQIRFEFFLFFNTPYCSDPAHLCIVTTASHPNNYVLSIWTKQRWSGMFLFSNLAFFTIPDTSNIFLGKLGKEIQSFFLEQEDIQKMCIIKGYCKTITDEF